MNGFSANSTVPASFGPMTRSRSKEIQQQKEQMLATSRARISASGMSRGNGGITEGGGSRSLMTSTPARHNQTAQHTNQSNGSLTVGRIVKMKLSLCSIRSKRYGIR